MSDTQGQRERRASGWRVPATVALALGLHWALAVTSLRHKSSTFDEVAHLTSGVITLQHGDYRFIPEAGTLAQRWAAAAVVGGEHTFPRTDTPGWRAGDAWSVGADFFHTQGNDLRALLRRARMMMVWLSVALGLLVFLWSRHLFGATGGLVSLWIYALSPTLLAHGRLVTTDVAAALCFLAAIGSLWRVLHRLTLPWFGVTVLTVTALMLSKMSGVLILPMAVVMILARVAIGRPLELRLSRGRAWVVAGRGRQALILAVAAACCACSVWAGVWAAYGGRYAPAVEATDGDPMALDAGPSFAFARSQLRREGLLTEVLDWARAQELLPEAYLHGLAITNEGLVRVSYLDGHVSLRGFRSFFLMTFLYKTPLATMGLIALSLVVLLGRRRTGPAAGLRGGYGLLPLGALAAVYTLVAILSKMSIGHRHLLPLYPVLFIVCGAAGRWMTDGRRWRRILVGGALGVLLAQSLWIWPHYLAFFNRIAGGPRQGHRHLVDSSLDWGQDLVGLAQYLRDGRHGGRPVYVSYFGTASLQYHGIEATTLPCYFPRSRADAEPVPWRAGAYCVSATMLHNVYTAHVRGVWCTEYETKYQAARKVVEAYWRSGDRAGMRRAYARKYGAGFWPRVFTLYTALRFGRLCAYLRHREPEARIGYTIMVHHLSDAALREALSGPPAERFAERRVADAD